MSRIEQHPILEYHKGKPVTFTFDGKEMRGYEGESVASALHAAGVRKLHDSEVKKRPRGLFCAIGNCSSCLMRVDGRENVRICIEPLREGMKVESQKGKAVLRPAGSLPGSIREEPAQTADVLIIGGGPAGLNAALESAKHGLSAIVLDRNQVPGGQLCKQTHKFFGSEKAKAGTRGFVIGQELESELEKSDKVRICTETTALGYFRDGTVMAECRGQVHIYRGRAVVIATGASEKTLIFPGNDLPGVCGAGAVQTLMNLDGILPGQTAVMVGAGNIGLIVSYQLLQAGVKVAAVVEAAPHFGGYEVHANKIRRAGVPILTSHTVKYAFGGEKLEGVVITALDEKFRPVPGTEQTIRADLLCMAVGLSPMTEMFFQAGCEMKFVPQLGGYVPRIDGYHRTTVKGLYAAGDAGGVEEATSAQLTGRIAALSAAADLGAAPDFDREYKAYADELSELRAGPMGGKILSGLEKMKEEGCVDYAKA
ncbi:MAG: FAD-dependent oxidoreductase [Lachnospiraceae bacterium]|jgi:sarcosine oxidase subunit alpha